MINALYGTYQLQRKFEIRNALSLIKRLKEDSSYEIYFESIEEQDDFFIPEFNNNLRSFFCKVRKRTPNGDDLLVLQDTMSNKMIVLEIHSADAGVEFLKALEFRYVKAFKKTRSFFIRDNVNIKVDLVGDRSFLEIGAWYSNRDHESLACKAVEKELIQLQPIEGTEIGASYSKILDVF